MLFPTTIVGSYPQPDWLIDREKLAGRFPPRVRAKELWRVAEPHLQQAMEDATLLAIRAQEDAGLDIITDGEIRRVVGSIEGDPCYVQELMQLKVKVDEDGAGKGEKASRPRDEMYIPAVEVVLREGRGSTSLLQRTLGIGYGRAARLIDAMAEEGIVGSYNGSSARDVLMSPEQWASSKTPTH
jgi:hypothetical protein